MAQQGSITSAQEATEIKFSQAEIDAHLAKVRSEQTTKEAKLVRPFAFQKPDYLSADKMSHIRVKHDFMVHELAPTLSLMLRREMSLKVARIETITQERLIEALPTRTHLTLFHLVPMGGAGLVEISYQLALTIVARLLGSQGHAVNSERNFTEIDLRLLDRIVDAILREYTNMWRLYEPQIAYSIDGHEQNPNFVKIADSDTIMIFLIIEAKFGTVNGFIRMALPHATLEPLITKLTAPVAGATLKKEAVPQKIQPQKPVMEVPIGIRAVWNGLKLDVSRLKTLKKDDVFVLNEDLASRTALMISNIHKFDGQVGRKGNHLAVRVTQKAAE